jgi:N-6 DNA Methylase
VSLYGQEKDAATAGLARMNMILHNNPTAEIKQGNTLANPLFNDDRGDLKIFDYVVANPLFSDKRWSTSLTPEHDDFDRFMPYGIPPGKQGDYAYLLYIIRSIKSTVKGAFILPHGVLFRGNTEKEIRRNLIRRGYIQGIIGLPANLFVDALAKYWAVCPQLKASLLTSDRSEYLKLAVPKDGIKTAIFTHPEFVAFSIGMAELFAAWRSRSAEMLKGLDVGCQPKVLISKLAEDLLEHYVGKDLIDRYDIYQHLLDYWAEVMQDDVYLIAADGWKAETYRVIESNKKGKEVDKEIKDAEMQIDRLVYDRYPTLTEGEIKVLVVDDKWLARIGAVVAGEIDRVSQGLTQRYEVPLPELVSQIAELEARVAGHLAKIGSNSKFRF